MYVIAEFREKESVEAAIRSIRAGGMSDMEMDLFSEEPVEFPRGVLDRPSRMSLASVTGAIVFGVLATGFIFWTQHNYNVVTGGMPVFSFWATGVITYEMTMLGAIVATFTWFLWESGLIRKRDRSAPVPQVSPGSICLRVCCRVEDSERAIEMTRRAGAVDIERKGEG